MITGLDLEMRLENIKYPIYPLRQYDSIERTQGRVFIHTYYSTYIIDDTNIEGSFSLRRLLLSAKISKRKANSYEYTPIYKLKLMINDEPQLFANMSKYKSYIDSTGKIFNLAPTTFYKVTYHKVLRVAIVEGKHALVFVEGVNTPFKIKRTPKPGTIYAGILQLPDRKILYELSRELKKDTRRKI